MKDPLKDYFLSLSSRKRKLWGRTMPQQFGFRIWADSKKNLKSWRTFSSLWLDTRLSPQYLGPCLSIKLTWAKVTLISLSSIHHSSDTLLISWNHVSQTYFKQRRFQKYALKIYPTDCSLPYMRCKKFYWQLKTTRNDFG